jgi:uncharacterized protein
MRLLPREEKFFQDFLDQVEIIQQAATVLRDSVTNGAEKLSEAATTIRCLEQKGDEIIHNIHTRLNSTFITPLDPEDIHSLATHLDDVLDGIEEASDSLVTYRVTEVTPAIAELAGIIVSCSNELEKAFEALALNKPMIAQCIELNRLEDLADGVGRAAIMSLFESERDPIQLIKLKEIYEILEATTDRCEDVADVLQGVIVKNS